jgi:hypothetical protein
MGNRADTVAEVASKLGVSEKTLVETAEQTDIDAEADMPLSAPLTEVFSGTFVHKRPQQRIGGLYFVEGKKGENRVSISRQS